jgi:hypothetical protein
MLRELFRRAGKRVIIENIGDEYYEITPPPGQSLLFKSEGGVVFVQMPKTDINDFRVRKEVKDGGS